VERRAAATRQAEAQRLAAANALFNFSTLSPTTVAARINGRPAHDFARAIAETLGASTDAVRDEFVGSRRFDSAISGDAEAVRDAPIAVKRFVFVEGREEVATSVVGGEPFYNARFSVTGSVIGRSSGAQPFTVQAEGSGFTEADAVRVATSALVKAVGSRAQ
jgi:hypothetical protein